MEIVKPLPPLWAHRLDGVILLVKLDCRGLPRQCGARLRNHGQLLGLQNHQLLRLPPAVPLAAARPLKISPRGRSSPLLTVIVAAAPRSGTQHAHPGSQRAGEQCAREGGRLQPREGVGRQLGEAGLVPEGMHGSIAVQPEEECIVVPVR